MEPPPTRTWSLFFSEFTLREIIGLDFGPRKSDHCTFCPRIISVMPVHQQLTARIRPSALIQEKIPTLPEPGKVGIARPSY